MSTENEAQSAVPQSQATNSGVVAVLDEEALRNLTGFMDVLIQMDLVQGQRNKRSEYESREI